MSELKDGVQVQFSAGSGGVSMSSSAQAGVIIYSAGSRGTGSSRATGGVVEEEEDGWSRGRHFHCASLRALGLSGVSTGSFHPVCSPDQMLMCRNVPTTTRSHADTI